MIKIASIFKNLSPLVIRLSIFSLLMSLSTQMIYAELGVVLKYEFHAAENVIAFVDGVVEFLSYLVRIFSGLLGDFFISKYSLLMSGAFISALLKPIFALAPSVGYMFFSEALERIANGVQACPRDALIKDGSFLHHTAESFGFNRALKTMGAVLGTLLAVFIMQKLGYKVLFALASFPAFLALFFLVRMAPQKTEKAKIKYSDIFEILKNVDKSLYKILALAFFCELAHFSEALLSIKAADFISYKSAGIVVLFMSLGQVFFSYQMGVLADKFDRLRLLFLAILVSIFANIVLINAKDIITLFVGVFFLCGAQSSLQCIFLAIISDKVSAGRASVIGFYFCLLGLSYFVSSLFAGNLWATYGACSAFYYSLAINIFSLFNCFLISRSFNFLK